LGARDGASPLARWWTGQAENPPDRPVLPQSSLPSPQHHMCMPACTSPWTGKAHTIYPASRLRSASFRRPLLACPSASARLKRRLLPARSRAPCANRRADRRATRSGAPERRRGRGAARGSPPGRYPRVSFPSSSQSVSSCVFVVEPSCRFVLRRLFVPTPLSLFLRVLSKPEDAMGLPTGLLSDGDTHHINLSKRSKSRKFHPTWRSLSGLAAQTIASPPTTPRSLAGRPP
jgi:hypothetical protein